MKRNSLIVKLWMYFSLFSASLLLLLWLLQIVFLGSFYEKMKIDSIEDTASEIVRLYGDDSMPETVDRLAMQKSMQVFITDARKTVIYSSDGHGPSDLVDPSDNADSRRPLPWGYDRFLDRLASSSQKYISYIVPNGFSAGRTLVCGANLPNDAVLYISAPLLPLDDTTEILRTQLLYVTVISLLLISVIAYFIAKKISKPIVKITDTAKSLAEGDYDIHFESSNYTEIEDLSQTLNHTVIELTKTETLRRELIANISHDLRTPLTMIQGYTEMIEDISGEDREKRNAHLSVIREESHRLEKLVNDILDLSSLQADCETMQLQNTDMSRMVQSVLSRFHDFAVREGFSIRSSIQPDLYAMVDPRRMEQVLYNLISNAIHYAGDKKTVNLLLSDRGDSVYFEVLDNGVGISEEDLPYIWDRYYSSKEHARSKVGSGIGLSIVKNILKQHQASYGVRSTQGSGTLFWFSVKK